jgi:hypothetical protein
MKPVRPIAILAAVAIASLSACSTSPLTLIGVNQIYVPAKVRPIVYYVSNVGEQRGINFYDVTGQLVDTVYLGPQIPNGTCVGPWPTPMTLRIAGWSVQRRIPLPVTVDTMPDPRFHEVKFTDNGNVVAVSTIGVPTLASPGCSDP